MANPIAIEKVKALFIEIEQKQNETGKWQLPPYVTAPFSNMQEIVVSDDAIKYNTRWHPNFEGLIQIADQFRLDFILKYDQPTHLLSGEATYISQVFNDNRLNNSKDDTQHYEFGR